MPSAPRLSRPSRRTVLTAGALAVGAGALGVGLRRTAERLESTVTRGTFTSAALGGVRTSWVVVYPRQVSPVLPTLPAGGRVQVVVALHDAGDDASVVTRLGLDVELARVVRDGVEPFVLAAVSGGPGTWTPAADGTDGARLVVREFLPLLAENYLATGPQHRVGLLGWGTGGTGALRVASLLGAQRVAAVAACGASGDGGPAPGALDGIAVRQDDATDDAARREVADAELRFLGDALARARRSGAP